MLFDKTTIVISATDESNSLIETVDFIFANCSCSDIDSVLIVIPKKLGEDCVRAIEFLEGKYKNKIKKLIQWYPYIGGAMRSAIEATNSSHILFFSADIPTNLECIPEMIAKAKESPDAIIKISRWLEKNSFISYSKSRKIFNFLAQNFIKILFGSNLTDFTCPILIAKTEIYKNILFKEFNFPCLLEAVLIPLKIGCDIKEISARSYARTEGKSKNSIWQTMLYFKTALRIRFMSVEKIYRTKDNK